MVHRRTCRVQILSRPHQLQLRVVQSDDVRAVRGCETCEASLPFSSRFSGRVWSAQADVAHVGDNTVDEDEVYAAFERAGADGDVFVQGAPQARVLLKVTPKRLYVLVDGEPAGKAISGVFSDAIRAGKINYSLSALVDLTLFTGSVDWDHIAAVSKMAPWGKDGTSIVAYVVRSNIFHNLIKIAATMFPDTKQQSFLDRAEAEAWLAASDRA